MLDLEKLNKMKRQAVERIKQDRMEDDKILIHIGEIIGEAVRQHASWYKKLEQLQKAFVLACRILDDRMTLCPQQFFDTGWTECAGEAEQCGDRPMWECWQKYLKEVVEKEPVCRVCGCTQDTACEGGCWWVETDLCSSCLGKEKAKIE